MANKCMLSYVDLNQADLRPPILPTMQALVIKNIYIYQMYTVISDITAEFAWLASTNVVTSTLTPNSNLACFSWLP